MNMLWLYAILIATILSGFGTVLHRRITEKEDVPSYSFLFTLVAGLFFIPLLFLENARFPTGFEWIPFLAAAFIWFLINIIGFTAAKYTEASLKAPLNTVKVIFLFVLAVVFLHDAVTPAKVLGTLVVFAGAFLLTWEKGSLAQLKQRGVQLTILTAFLTAVVALLDKFNMLLGFSRNFYGAAMYLVPCFFHGLRVTRRKHHLKQIVANRGWLILTAGIIYGVIYYLDLFAYSFKEAEISIIYPIAQLDLLVAVGLSYVWLGERGSLLKRVMASALMIIGAVLVTVPISI